MRGHVNLCGGFPLAISGPPEPAAKQMILVTGGAGFIGSNLVGALGEQGLPVAVCDRLGTDDKWKNLARAPLQDVIPPEGLEEYLRERGSELTHVFHLGAITSTLERSG